VVDVVMINFDFRLGFKINRKQLDKIMKSKEGTMIVSSIFETTSHTNVKIRMKKYPPENMYYDCLELKENNDQNEMIKLKTNPYKNPQNNKKASKYHTFLVPHSGKVILSGKYISLLREQYEIFLEIISEYRDEIEYKKPD